MRCPTEAETVSPNESQSAGHYGGRVQGDTPAATEAARGGSFEVDRLIHIVSRRRHVIRSEPFEIAPAAF